MNNKQKTFLESGVVEDYCLGTACPEDVEKLMELCKQYPEAQLYLEQNQKTMEAFVGAFSRKPSTTLKKNIHGYVLENIKLEKAKLTYSSQMLPEFIGISPYSKVEHWDSLLKEIEPDTEFDNIFAKEIFLSEKEELTLVWAKDSVPEEIHDDMKESFLILEGSVDCYVEGEIFSMRRGDYMEIPLNANHKVVVTSSIPGKAIRSRVRL